MKKIGISNSPSLVKSLSHFIKAEEARQEEEWKKYAGRFTSEEWWDSDEAIYGSKGGTKPWWADFGLDDDDYDDDNYEDDLGLDPGNEPFDEEYYQEHKNDHKMIYFYENPDNRFESQEFYSMKEFNDFCTEHDIFMTDETANDIIYNTVSYCCLDPSEKELGNNILVSDRSYGGLMWTIDGEED